MSPPIWEQRNDPPLEHRARGYHTPELHNWSPPRGVVSYSCFFRSAYSFASSHSQHRQAPTIQYIGFPSTTSTSHMERGPAARDQDTARVTTGTVYRRATIYYTLHHQSTITVHAESTPTRAADVVARSTGATVRFGSITESVTSGLGDNSTYTLDGVFTASASATQNYERATGRVTVNFEPVTAQAGDDHLAKHTFIASSIIAQSTQMRNHSVHEARPAARSSIAADGQRLKTTTCIQERVPARTGSNLVEDASRGTGRTPDPDAHVTVHPHAQRGSSLGLREFWSGVATLAARKHEEATPHKSLTMTARARANTSNDGLSILASGGTRRGITAGLRGRHTMDRRASRQAYVGYGGSITKVPTDTSGSSPHPLDEFFLEILRLTARTFERDNGPAGDRLARITATQLSDAIPSDATVSPANSEQATAHQYDRSEGVAAASRGQDKQSASRTPLRQLVNVSPKSAYKSRSECTTGRSWRPASNQARDQGIQGTGHMSDTSMEHEGMRERKGRAREASQQMPLAEVQTAAEAYTTDHLFTVEDDPPRPKEQTRTETQASGQARDVITEVTLTGGIATRGGACPAVVGCRHRTPFGEVLALIRGDRGGTEAPHLVDLVRTYGYSSVSNIGRENDERMETSGRGTSGASSGRDGLGPRERDSRRAGVACKDLAATGIAEGRDFDGELGRDEKRMAGGETSSAATGSACSREQQEVGEFLVAARRVFKTGNDRLRLYQQAAQVSRVTRRVAITSVEDGRTGRCHPTGSGPLSSLAEDSTATPRGAPCMQAEETYALDVREDTLARDGATADALDTRKEQERQAQAFRGVVIRATEIELTYGVSSTDYAYPGHSSPSARTVLYGQEHATSTLELGVDDALLLSTQRIGDGRDCGRECANLARAQEGGIIAMHERQYDGNRGEDYKQSQIESVERGLRRETIAQAPEPRSAQPTGVSLVTQVEDSARAFSQFPRLFNTTNLSTLEIAWRCAKQSATSGDRVAEGTAGEPRYRKRADDDSGAGRKEHGKVGGLVEAMRRVPDEQVAGHPTTGRSRGTHARAAGQSEGAERTREEIPYGEWFDAHLQAAGARYKTADSKRAEVRDIDDSQSEEAELGKRGPGVTTVQVYGLGPAQFTTGRLVSQVAEDEDAIPESRFLRSNRTPGLSSLFACNTIGRHALREVTGGTRAIGGGCHRRGPGNEGSRPEHGWAEAGEEWSTPKAKTNSIIGDGARPQAGKQWRIDQAKRGIAGHVQQSGLG
ncbi:uncharacterized protein B0H18DRAFT_1131895 [Fomitopsis serialis]|uniref:uncharacterized protein n=1 Tax=Fomitopsis serialis TaxID=139415 RepID=UPI002008B7DE|nr:uncharacterized protein B0H18DRAFT_1131895 [Neoantrodia serialis]KAH9906577.1 hypothetical protein B0H18DRAFT_1131895 [Neoantrodia serialis]